MPPKTGHERIVPLSPELHAVLAEVVRRDAPTARVVVNRRGRTPGRQHVLTVFKSLQQRCGLKERSFHSLRHYFCSALVRRSASVEAVRLGFSKIHADRLRLVVVGVSLLTITQCHRSSETGMPSSSSSARASASAPVAPAPSVSRPRTPPDVHWRVTLVQLLARPERWDGQKISVGGYVTRDGGSLLLNPEARADMGAVGLIQFECPSPNEVPVDVAAKLIRWSEFRPHERGVYATVEGTFRNIPAGEWGEDGTICQLTDIRIADGEFNKREQERIVRNAHDSRPVPR